MKLLEIEKRTVWYPEPDGNIRVSSCGLTSLKQNPYKNTHRGFYCNNNDLVSLEGAPKIVGGDFECGGNKLVSLDYAPERVGGDFGCGYNRLTNLHNIHKIIKYIGGSFFCGGHKITSNVLGLCLIKGLNGVYFSEDDHILNDIFEKYLRDINLCQEALIDAGLHKLANL